MTTLPTSLFLDHTAPVPIDVPFTRALARAEGVSDRRLRVWLDQGLVVSPLRGVYHAAQLEAGLALRIACLRLLVPADAVVTGRTAGWLHGAAMILAPNDHLIVPKVSVHLSPGRRLRNGLTASGERTFTPDDLVEIDGIRASSILRTTVDLAMVERRDAAIGAMDQMAALTKDADFVPQLCAELDRFRGHRGIIQARQLAPLVDGRAGSPPESVLRLRWFDCPSLPVPTPQVPVLGPWGTYYLDLGVESLKYAVEYDGPEWHGPEQAAHDEGRRTDLRDLEQWIIDVVSTGNIYGRHQDIQAILQEGIAGARRRTGSGSWHGQGRRRTA